MLKIDKNNDTIHIIGIGGIGMSGIAEILLSIGYKVQGSDNSESTNTERLKNLGIKVYIGQKKENLENASIIVKSSAIKDSNTEIIAANENNLPVIFRAQMLAYIMNFYDCIAIAGTHGKTTTTSMITSTLENADLSPTFINGGIINFYGTNAKTGTGNWLVAEADESDGTFIELPAKIGVVTNIDAEHMEHYGSFDNLLNCFKQFITQLKQGGFGVLCNDHEIVRKLGEELANEHHIVTYGIEQESDVMAINIKNLPNGSQFDVKLSNNMMGGQRIIENIMLTMPGVHNILNSLAAISVGLKLAISDDKIRTSFSNFEGVQRRFTNKGQALGATIIDDYAHHPKEIAVTLKTAKSVAKETNGKVIAVFQPHRYSRVADLFEDFCACFGDADQVVVTDIYEAGESPLEGITKDNLVKNIIQKSNKNTIALNKNEDLAKTISQFIKSGDIVVCMGAGSISAMATKLPSQINNLKVAT